jgi:site-specific recombinase XerD
VPDARLDRIDEAMIDSYIQHRRESVSPASVNRELATLRKALQLAHEWRIIDRVLTLHECAICSFRHTFGTRLGEAGADAFTIMKAMGHSTVTVSQKYAIQHPRT